jgi:hypothetical protein
VNDGDRTHDNRNHNPGLYQLSYIHHKTWRTRQEYSGLIAHRPARIPELLLAIQSNLLPPAWMAGALNLNMAE